MDKVARNVRVFGDKVVKCLVEVYNEEDVNHVYAGDSLLWIERGEDEYARPHYKKLTTPHAIVYRNDYVKASKV